MMQQNEPKKLLNIHEADGLQAFGNLTKQVICDFNLKEMTMREATLFSQICVSMIELKKLLVLDKAKTEATKFMAVMQ
jgi:hypothetical protein